MLPHHFARALTATSLLAIASACGRASTEPTPQPLHPDTAPPPIVREMRGLWIATVANIDWPSRSTLSADQQRAELSDILERAAAAGFNAVVFQIRPAADAVYPSSLEPWAAMLTGKQGTDPGYDPLAYAITQAHARGLELHAWINPFRAGNTRDSAALTPTHLFTRRRDLVRVYGSQLWLDPGEQEVHDHVIGVVRDIVQRYDIDAVHADDYFYPYPQSAGGRRIEFPDSATYANSGTTLSRADWRRANVDRFVERLYREVHALKPAIKVGLSPFGIWRPGNPPGVTGLDAYDAIYADSRKWLQQGWVDYLAPQLYWAIAAPQQSFPALLDWWMAQNAAGRHVWPGLAAYRVGDGTASAFSASEIPEQIKLTRQRTAGPGHLLYNTTATLKRAGGSLAASLAPLYAGTAIVPASPWLDDAPPPSPVVGVAGSSVQINAGAGKAARWWLVRSHSRDTWRTTLLFGTHRTLVLPEVPDRVLVNAIDQAGHASAATSWAR